MWSEKRACAARPPRPRSMAVVNCSRADARSARDRRRSSAGVSSRMLAPAMVSREKAPAVKPSICQETRSSGARVPVARAGGGGGPTPRSVDPRRRVRADQPSARRVRSRGRLRCRARRCRGLRSPRPSTRMPKVDLSAAQNTRRRRRRRADRADADELRASAAPRRRRRTGRLAVGRGRTHESANSPTQIVPNMPPTRWTDRAPTGSSSLILSNNRTEKTTSTPAMRPMMSGGHARRRRTRR